MRLSRRGVSTVEYVIIVAGLALAVIGAASWIGKAQNQALAKLDFSPAGTRAEKTPNAPAPVAAAAVPGTSLMTVMAVAAFVFFMGFFAALAIYLRYRAIERRELKEMAKRQPLQPKDQAKVRRRMEEKRNMLNQVLRNHWASVVQADIKVSDLMTRELITVCDKDPVDLVQTRMQNEQLHHVLVVDELGNFIGILSDRDLKRRAGKTAGEIMTPQPISIRSDTELKQAITIILLNGFSAIPIVDEGKLVGIITSNDLIATLHCTLARLCEISYMLKSEGGRELIEKALCGH